MIRLDDLLDILFDAFFYIVRMFEFFADSVLLSLPCFVDADSAEDDVCSVWSPGS